MINVNVKFFGPLRDIVRRDDLAVELPDGCTGERAFDYLASLHPRLGQWKSSVRLAVNLEYREPAQTLRAGDEVSFIPPVSGG